MPLLPPGSLTVLLTVLLSLAGALGLAGAAAPAAHAVPPLTELEDEITDPAGVLGDDAAEVQESLDRLADETPYQLFVVYVDSFDGVAGRDWANATATNAALGVDDLLLAVATEDGAYGLSVDSSIALSDERLDAVESAAEDELRDGAWADAAIAAADTVLDGAPGSGGGPAWGVVLVVLVVGLLAVAGWFWFRSRRRSATQGATTIGRHGTPVPGEAALAGLDTDELERRAGAALVEVDDALRTSEQELGFAQAEFGVEATREFAAALETARGDVTGAFRRQQELDDETPEDEAQRRGILLDVLARCERAAAALDAQTDAFDELRDLHARAPELLTETAQRADELDSRVDVARQTLAGLTTTYPASALASVRENPDQAAALVANARDAVATGQEALTERTRNSAVGHLRAAQNALGQAGTLLEAVETAGTALATASADLDKGIASITQDVSDAERLAPGDPAVGAAVTEARAAVDQARDARSGGDPLAALRRITAAEAALD
ncbi:TPM domain-containing protein, partial [Isoptericola cucumis]|uniref:TPM domain-containing protein n=1 Tax=Isoptericola cucumis TaxID=1776856 RepID=UPI00320A1AF8